MKYLIFIMILLFHMSDMKSQNCDRLAILDNYPIIRSPSCGLPNGSIEIRATGNGNVEYRLNGSTFQSSGLFTGLDEFDHVITFRDNQNCVKTISVPLRGENPIQIQSIQSTNASCSQNDGQITVNAVGEALQYSIDGNTYQFNNVFNNLRPAPYTVYIRDVNGCIIQDRIVITRGSISVSRINNRESDCGVNNGEIEILATGDGLRYMLDGVTSFTSNNVFSNLSPRTYRVIIEDAGGCRFTRNIAIRTDFSVNYQSFDSDCSNPTGQISVNVNTPGTYEYSIDGAPFQNSSVFTNLATGVYSVRFRNTVNRECSASRNVRVGETVTIQNFSASSSPTTCTSNSGTISTQANGVGAITYTVSKDAFSESNITGQFSNLEEGVYTIRATDSNNCSIATTETVQVINDISSNPTFSTQLSTCSEATGQITVSITSSSGGLMYGLNGSIMQSSNIFNDVPGGINIVRVESSNGCFREFDVEVGEAQNDISVTNLNIITPSNRCSGDGSINIAADGTDVEYSLDGVVFQPSGLFRNLDAGTYIVFMRNAEGCTRQTGEIELISTFSLIGFDFTPTNCLQDDGEVLIFANGEEVTFQIDNRPVQISNSFTNVSPGVHSLTLTDVNNCVIQSNFEMPNLGFVDIQDVEITPSFCGEPNNQILVFAVNDTLTMEYSLNDQNYFTDSLFVELPAGNTTIYVRDQFGCKDTFNVVLPSSSTPVLDLKINPSICDKNNGSIQVDHTGGVGQLQYSINQSIFQNNNVFNNLSPGQYTIDVQDGVGCFVSDTVEIVLSCEALFPNVITPNGNGENDIFRLNYYIPLNINSFIIYDRWGKELYSVNSFLSTDTAMWWDGKGRQEGSYLAYIEYEIDGEVFQKSTSFIILY